jgi:hypothetical protein
LKAILYNNNYLNGYLNKLFKLKGKVKKVKRVKRKEGKGKGINLNKSNLILKEIYY